MTDYNNARFNINERTTFETISPQARDLIKSLEWHVLHQYETFCHTSNFGCPIWSLELIVIIDDRNKTLSYYRFDEEPYEIYHTDYSDVYLMNNSNMTKQALAIIEPLAHSGQITFQFEKYGWGKCDKEGPVEHIWTLYVFVKSDPTGSVTKHKYYREVFERQGDIDEEEVYEKTEYNSLDDDFLYPILRKVS
jgi:hypothetical protein